ncbi:MAG: hypothetical protein FJW34_17195 [Acidobacteria bacterium]|nr:hypothetical protein [Acidobacteriota bacterium]
MAQLEKHKTNLVREWLVDDEETVPAHPRGLEAQEARLKIRKPPVPGKFRQPRSVLPAPKPEPALIREPAPPSRAGEKQSQATSREHLLKLERLPQLRAPFSRSRQAAPTAARQPRARTLRTPARRAAGGRASR